VTVTAAALQRSVGGETDCSKVVINGGVRKTVAYISVVHSTASESASGTRQTHQVLTTSLLGPSRSIVCLVIGHCQHCMTRFRIQSNSQFVLSHVRSASLSCTRLTTAQFIVLKLLSMSKWYWCPSVTPVLSQHHICMTFKWPWIHPSDLCWILVNCPEMAGWIELVFCAVLWCKGPVYLKLYYCPITIPQTTDDHFYGFSSRHITSFEVAAFRCSVMSMYIYLTSCYLLLLVTLPHEAAMRYIPSVRLSVCPVLFTDR